MFRLVPKHRLPTPAVNEARLLHEAAAVYPDLEYRDLDRERLALLTQEHGTDFATALFYDRVRRSWEHGRFIREVEAMEPELDRLPRLEGKLLLAPAGFYREYPEFGGDGRLAREIAAEFGLRAELLPVRTGARLRENGEVIREALCREPERGVILLSLSKGGAEARLALEDPQARRAVRAWVQICGLVRGTQDADDLLLSRWGRRGMVRAALALGGVGTDVLHDLRNCPGSLLSAPASSPPGVPVINVVAFPLACHLGPTTGARYRRLAPLGPNDGSTLLRDAILEPGLVYPVWGADHYFRVPEVSALLYRLFLYLARQEEQNAVLAEAAAAGGTA